MIERTPFRWERWLALAGLAYAFVHRLFLTQGGVGPDASVTEAQQAFVEAPAQAILSGALFQASALLVLVFGLSLRAHVQGAEQEPKTLSGVMLGAAFASTMLAFVGSACTFIIGATVARLGDANLTYALLQMWWAMLLSSTCMQGILVLAGSALGLMTRALPRWIGGLGLVCGLALTGGCLAYFPTGGVVEGPADAVAYIGENLLAIWAIAVAIVILRARRAPSATEVVRVRAGSVAAR